MSTDGRAGIDAGLVGRLVADQFPQWRDLPVVPVEADGWDNRTYRLGSELSVRLPTADSYVPAVDKEQRWLPVLAPRLPLQVPEAGGPRRPLLRLPAPVVGTPLDRGHSCHARASTRSSSRVDLAEFLVALRAVDGVGDPACDR